MFKVIVQAGNDDQEFILKARAFALRYFAEKDPKVVVRNADAYDPHQHEAADAMVTQSWREELIWHYEQHDTEVIAVNAEMNVSDRDEEDPEQEDADNDHGANAPMSDHPGLEDAATPPVPGGENADAVPSTSESVANPTPEVSATTDVSVAEPTKTSRKRGK